MDEFYGKKYVLVNNKHFAELLVFLGVSYVQRQIAMTLKPVQYLTRKEDGMYSLHFCCAFVNSEVVFTPGVDFDETKPNGVKVRSLITIKDNKLMHRQIEGNGRTLNHIYEFFPDKMVITTRGVGFDKVVKRYYNPVDVD